MQDDVPRGFIDEAAGGSSRQGPLVETIVSRNSPQDYK